MCLTAWLEANGGGASATSNAGSCGQHSPLAKVWCADLIANAFVIYTLVVNKFVIERYVD